MKWWTLSLVCDVLPLAVTWLSWWVFFIALNPPEKKTTSKWDVISVFKANVPLTSDSFFPPPNRDHDYRHLPHPVEMGPQESWNSHPDCGEASGAPGHAGISADMQSLLIKPVQMVAQGLLRSCAFLFYFFLLSSVGSRSFVTGQSVESADIHVSPTSHWGGQAGEGCEVWSTCYVLPAAGSC